MHAMVLDAPGLPLKMHERADPEPSPGQIPIKVSPMRGLPNRPPRSGFGLPGIKFPIVPGHEIVGFVDRLGNDVSGQRIGDRVGIPWLAYTCGACRFCQKVWKTSATVRCSPDTRAMAADATHAIADGRFAFPLWAEGDDVSIAPLLAQV